VVVFRSTGPSGARAASFGAALFQGQAPDGGLFVPENVPQLDFGPLRRASFLERAQATLSTWLGGELPRERVEARCREAFDFPVPLSRLDDSTWLLELFHGPTAAFKDFGARFMARAMEEMRPPGRRLTILVATSGDTGSAVAQAFAGIDAVRVVLLYPAGMVSELQELQLTAVPANATSLRVQGSFDDCQAMVKAAFRDVGFATRLGLTSANSINIGRLLPQISYYVHASLELATTLTPLVCVPSGNLGNLTAGLLAKRQGAPIARFLAAANRNDAFPELIATGTLRPRAALHTPSNAMDVGNPSNAARILALYGGNVEALRRDVAAESIGDAETLATIRRVHEETGRFVCPHTAVGLAALRRHREATGSREVAIVLATAHPAKFEDIVRAATGAVPPRPPSLEGLARAKRLPVDLEPEGEALVEYLRNFIA
jgi:threonine synthase